MCLSGYLACRPISVSSASGRQLRTGGSSRLCCSALKYLPGTEPQQWLRQRKEQEEKNHSCSLLGFLSWLPQHSCVCRAFPDTQSCLRGQQGHKSMVQGPMPRHAARSRTLPTSSRRLPFSIAHVNAQSNLPTSLFSYSFDVRTDNTINFCVSLSFERSLGRLTAQIKACLG